MNAADSLRESAEIHEERGKVYGNSYKEFGPILKGLFPEGITLETEEDMNRFAPLMMITVKMQRYCKNFQKGGHHDSLIDISTYSAMLNELDFDMREKFKNPILDDIPMIKSNTAKLELEVDFCFGCENKYNPKDKTCKRCIKKAKKEKKK